MPVVTKRRSIIAAAVAAAAVTGAVLVWLGGETVPGTAPDELWMPTPRRPQVIRPDVSSVAARRPTARTIAPSKASPSSPSARTIAPSKASPSSPSARTIGGIVGTNIYAALGAYQRSGDAGLRDLFGEQYIADRQVQAPPFMLGCSFYGGELWGVVTAPQDVMPTPVVHLWPDRNVLSKALRTIYESERPVLAVCMLDELPGEFVDLLGRTDNIAAIVLGHALAADKSTSTFPRWAQRLDAERAICQALTDAPVYLAVSYVNAHDSEPTRINESGRWWPLAFGDGLTKWDGFAVYNINGFAWFEFNDLTKTRRALALPDGKPVLLFELIGTAANDDRSAEIWRRKSFSLMPKIVRQGWSGLILYSNNDAAVKQQAIEHLRGALP